MPDATDRPASVQVERAARCSRCGGTDNPRPLPKRFACRGCGPRLLCYACDVSHNLWCGPCQKHTQCIDTAGHDGPCKVPAWSEVWSRD